MLPEARHLALRQQNQSILTVLAVPNGELPPLDVQIVEQEYVAREKPHHQQLVLS
jgi:hypothetical protein